jgi:hypothetical protein
LIAIRPLHVHCAEATALKASQLISRLDSEGLAPGSVDSRPTRGFTCSTRKTSAFRTAAQATSRRPPNSTVWVETVDRTGEVRLVAPDGGPTICVNNRRKDGTREVAL